MNVKTNAEKEWLRKMEGGIPRHQAEDVAPARAAAAKKENTPKTHAGSGFQDVAGMDELKQLVMEGFINVLNNKECAKAFGVTPPSLLFYGPSGCGKTYFAEKIAEEVGVNFMKIVPDEYRRSWQMCSDGPLSQHRLLSSSTSLTQWYRTDPMMTGTIRTGR